MAWFKRDKGVNWLHISDFHLKEDGAYDSDVVARALIESLPTLKQRFGAPDIVFATGDVAYSGKPAEYKRATDLFDKILETLALDRSRLIVVPGNHDVDRASGRGLIRTVQGRDEADEYFDPIEPFLHLTCRLKAFRDWFNRYFDGLREFPVNTTCAPAVTVDTGRAKVQVLPINTATFAYDDNDHAKLLVGRRCLDKQISDAQSVTADLKIAVMHHPLDWLSPIESTNIKTSLREYADIILSGHLHENDVEHVLSQGNGILKLTAGATYQAHGWPKTAMFCEFNSGSISIAPIHYSDAPQPCWVADTSLFPNAPDYIGRIQLGQCEAETSTEDADGLPASLGGNDILDATIGPAADKARIEFERDLFLSPTGATLYAEPRLMTREAEFVACETDPANRISIDDLVDASTSFIVETRPEYGGTTLCRRLAYEFASRNHVAFARDARHLPAYRGKLEREFPSDIQCGGTGAVLILDNFDIERDERILRELEKLDWFKRVIVIALNRGLLSVRPIDHSSLPFRPTRIFLWAMSREDVRGLSCTLFASHDDVFISKVVEKVYDDLLGLCIPLTPSNVVMYLRVLYKEGDFHPLNRVDIVGRYISETLRRPSDAYADSFSAKNKADILSSFVYKLYTSSKSDFDDRFWFEFCTAYQRDTLSDFDAHIFLDELIESRVFGRFGRQIYLKYSFFYTYFLGRYISSRPEMVDAFVTDEEYLRMAGVVDVITGLSAENSSIVRQLADKLAEHLEAFADKYVRKEFDPLLKARWPYDEKEEENLWKPIQAAIASGPSSTKEIDELKSSMLAESRTSDQEVRFEKFSELEHALFAVDLILSEALKNADDIAGDLKLAALECILCSNLVVFQVGTMFAPALATRNQFRWGGIQFFDFNQFGKELDPASTEAFARVFVSLCHSISLRLGESLGTQKLAGVFRERAKSVEKIGFVEVLLFYCILNAKGVGWFETLKDLIEKSERESFYLCAMLDGLMQSLARDIGRAKDRDATKRLVATIQAKRSYRTMAPGSKAVTSMLRHLEKTDHFTPLAEATEGDAPEEPAPR